MASDLADLGARGAVAVAVGPRHRRRRTIAHATPPTTTHIVAYGGIAAADVSSLCC